MLFLHREVARRGNKKAKRINHLFGDKSNLVDLDLDWLNHRFIEETREAIQKALRRRVFKCSAGKNRKGIELPKMKKRIQPVRKVTDL